MEKPKYGMAILCAAILLLGLISAIACIAAEFKRTKAKDVRLDGKLCSLPGSPAFGLGLAASICLLAAQVIGTSAIGWQLCSREKKLNTNDRRKATTIILFILSWIAFGFAIIFLGVGSSMNHSQRYGDGWLKGQCYVVNDGVYIGAAVLVLATVIFTLGFTFTARMTDSREQGELGRRVHAQKQGENGEAGVNCKQ
ncbi:protein MODIFYING WALL LIGNIN-1-like [Magnolia sinica]|uniref:protein MODIFYING WALL LIGNIN-1-like n=1 Tax=Magnolia sinica TaxID=86752 RepID=UPI00265847C0|nr:protein MODIFYING WALL LIGNIN-1-like [Magnolia sinica]